MVVLHISPFQLGYFASIPHYDITIIRQTIFVPKLRQGWPNMAYPQFKPERQIIVAQGQSLRVPVNVYNHVIFLVADLITVYLLFSLIYTRI